MGSCILFFFLLLRPVFFSNKTKQKKVGYSEYPGNCVYVIKCYPPISRWSELVRSFVLIMIIVIIILYSHFNRYELNSM